MSSLNPTHTATYSPAWRWWHAQQQQRQQQQANTIRDGVLQQAFGFRRYLEQISVSAADNPPESTWLTRFNQLYQQLETLSNELLPPFAEDSLPLALQCLLNRRPIPIPLAAPRHERDLPVASNQTVLAVVSELLPILQTHPQPWQAHLTYSDEGQILSFTCDVLATSAVPQLQNTKEINYLQAIFHSLTSGTLEINQVSSPDQTAHLSCQLAWPVPAANASPPDESSA
ncbi:MAG: hypothetical protein AAFU71_07295 [Cyanobacteria bacterium J06632_22]